MKNAVDRQELKIQTSLVNDENVDVNNRMGRKNVWGSDECMEQEYLVAEFEEIEEIGKGPRTI